MQYPKVTIRHLPKKDKLRETGTDGREFKEEKQPQQQLYHLVQPSNSLDVWRTSLCLCTPVCFRDSINYRASCNKFIIFASDRVEAWLWSPIDRCHNQLSWGSWAADISIRIEPSLSRRRYSFMSELKWNIERSSRKPAQLPPLGFSFKTFSDVIRKASPECGLTSCCKTTGDHDGESSIALWNESTIGISTLTVPPVMR